MFYCRQPVYRSNKDIRLPCKMEHIHPDIQHADKHTDPTPEKVHVRYCTQSSSLV